MEKATKKPLLTRGYLCYRWREHAEARPLRLDNALVFHSVSATNCLQNYNFFRNRAKNLENSCFFPVVPPIGVVFEEVVIQQVADFEQQVGVNPRTTENLVGVLPRAAQLRGQPSDGKPSAGQFSLD